MSIPSGKRLDGGPEAPAIDQALEQVRGMVKTCIQCGTCSGSCPNVFAMDKTPRKMWRQLIAGNGQSIFDTHTFDLCSACYACTLRCPRGLPLTEAMGRLKQIAARFRLGPYAKSRRFYGAFMESVRRHGRVREMELMTLYFTAMKNPFLPLRFAGLGMRLMGKGKVHLQIPSKGRQRLDRLYRKAEEMEGRS